MCLDLVSERWQSFLFQIYLSVLLHNIAFPLVIEACLKNQYIYEAKKSAFLFFFFK